MSQKLLLGTVLLLLAGCASQSGIPEFKSKFVKAGLDNDFADFVDIHAGEPVRLDLEWERGAFRGGTDRDAQFFVLFENCAETLEKDEVPEVGNCNGTEYRVPLRKGAPLVADQDGRKRLRGVFEPAERTGPSQGLFTVALVAVE